MGQELLKLNLGCCDTRFPGYIGVDKLPGKCVDVVHDLASIPWPWLTSSVQYIHAHDVLEHLPDKQATMEEIWRVLVPDGLADIIVPTSAGFGAWQDPTHKSVWTPNDFLYYTPGVPEYERFKRWYNIQAAFIPVTTAHECVGQGVWRLKALLRAVK